MRLPPQLPATSPRPTNLTLGVLPPQISDEFPDINESVAKDVAQELLATGLFADAQPVSQPTPASDLVVRITELKRVDPGSWCAESYAYAAFTAFVVPGCERSLGYRLAFERPGQPPIDFDYEYDALHLSGWVAPFTHALPGWSLPRADADRRIDYLRAQLAPIVPRLEAAVAGAT